MPMMPITVTFDEATLPAMLDGLVRAERSLQSLQEVFEPMFSEAGVGEDFASAVGAVESLRMMIDDAVLRAVAEAN